VSTPDDVVDKVREQYGEGGVLMLSVVLDGIDLITHARRHCEALATEANMLTAHAAACIARQAGYTREQNIELVRIAHSIAGDRGRK
jgi:hypothetical protein